MVVVVILCLIALGAFAFGRTEPNMRAVGDTIGVIAIAIAVVFLLVLLVQGVM